MLPLALEGTEVPHWAIRPEDEWAAFEDFPTFLSMVWEHLGLPPITRAQRRIAQRLQRLGDGARDIIRAFRGVGKSYISAAYCLWRLVRNPKDEKILVVSATGNKSKEFVSQVKAVLSTWDFLNFIRPTDNERNQADRFDVVGASIAQSHSLKAVGITGQITGSRATLIVADDVEIEGNSKTEEARQRILNSCQEFEAIVLPGADVVYLGTPQTEESVYNRLVIEQNYDCFCLPARFPPLEKLTSYELLRNDGRTVNILDPWLATEFDAGRMRVGQPIDPERFDNEELLKRESKGRSFFALQYQLDTSLSDAERYPLRQKDLIVLEVSPLKAPVVVQWGVDTSNRKNVIHDIPNLGFSGDQLLRPLFMDEEWRAYEGGVIFVDPSGRGKDETAWAVMKVLNGVLYLLKIGHEVADPTKAMTEIAMDAKRYGIHMIEVEPNFGQGMWVAAFQPILGKIWAKGGATVLESEWAKGQKETRIIDTLEPVLTQHRLVVAESFIRADAAEDDRNYSFLYQLTHITRDRGSLAHDDRIDALAGAVAHFQRAMMQDVNQAAQAMRDAEMEAEIEDFLEGFNQPTYRGMKINGHRVQTWTSEGGWSGDGDWVLHNTQRWTL